MLFHAKNGTAAIENDLMDYVRFGNGRKTLIMLPGLGDGLTTVRGMALPMAFMYRMLTKEYTVYVFSRRRALPEGYTTRDMARDQAKAMELLNIDAADLIGVSMGGMIAQHLAADYPQRVNRLVITVTAPCTNPLLTRNVQEWVACAQQGDHTALMRSNVRQMYTEAYYRRNSWLIPIMGKLTKPASYRRFFIQAAACVAHDARESLSAIRAETLVVGGGKDATVGGEPSQQLAQAIDGAVLHMYDEGAHALYEEEKGFFSLVLAFLNE